MRTSSVLKRQSTKRRFDSSATAPSTVCKRVARAAGRRCQLCNLGSVPLNVHHRTYERRGEELDEDLTVLCRECHHTFHEHRKLGR